MLWSRPESERADRPLLLMLHGRGSQEADLAGLADAFPPELVVASLRGPVPDGPGFSWFQVTRPGNPFPYQVDGAADAVLSWLDGQPFAPSSLGLLGFSQGAVVSLQLLRRVPERVGYALNLSGLVGEGSEPGDDAIARHPVFWGRGDADPRIEPGPIALSEAWLSAHVDLEEHVYPGLGHSISREELDDIAAFLKARLP